MALTELRTRAVSSKIVLDSQRERVTTGDARLGRGYLFWNMQPFYTIQTI